MTPTYETTICLKVTDFNNPADFLKFIDQGEEEIFVHLSGVPLKHYPATMYARNGDPGDPEEGGYCEDIYLSVGLIDITEMLTEKALDRANEELYAYCCECNEPDPDYERDCKEDR